MADIELIIKIPESMYEGVMLDRVLDTTVIRILDEIKNSTPLDDILDKIRVEIEGELEQDNHSFYRAALEDVLKIIDKYKKG